MQSLPRDVALAGRYYDFAAQHGDPHSCFLLANWYMEGVNSSDSGNSDSSDSDNSDGGSISTIGIEKDVVKGIEYLNRASAIGHPVALFNLAVWHMTGLRSDGSVVIQNQNIQYNKSNKQSNAKPNANTNTKPNSYSKPKHIIPNTSNTSPLPVTVVIEPDLLKSLQLFDQSSVLGYAPASLNLGQIFHHGYITTDTNTNTNNSSNIGTKGVSVEQDLNKAAEIYKRHASVAVGFTPCIEQLRIVQKMMNKKK